MISMEKQKEQLEPGDAGSVAKNGTRAERAAHIRVERKRIWKYDRALRHDAKNAFLLLAVGVGLAAAAAALIWCLTWWGIVSGVLVGAAAGALLWFKIGELRYLLGSGRAEMYDDSLLIGAVVVREEPLTVLALTDIGTSHEMEYRRYFDGEKEISKKEYMDALREAEKIWDAEWEDMYLKAETPERADELYDSYWIPIKKRLYREDKDAVGRWACKLHVVGSGDWSYKKGDRMPCSSGYGAEDEEQRIWTMMEVIPLVWGTRNEEDLKRCMEAIPAFEWELLDKLAPKAEEMDEDELYFVYNRPNGTVEIESFDEALAEEEVTESWDPQGEERAYDKEEDTTVVELDEKEF